jgi:hypothetical protein
MEMIDLDAWVRDQVSDGISRVALASRLEKLAMQARSEVRGLGVSPAERVKVHELQRVADRATSLIFCLDSGGSPLGMSETDLRLCELVRQLE